MPGSSCSMPSRRPSSIGLNGVCNFTLCSRTCRDLTLPSLVCPVQTGNVDHISTVTRVPSILPVECCTLHICHAFALDTHMHTHTHTPLIAICHCVRIGALLFCAINACVLRVRSSVSQRRRWICLHCELIFVRCHTNILSY